MPGSPASSVAQSDDAPVWMPLLAVSAALLVIRYGVLFGSDLSLHGDEAQYWTWSRDFTFGYYSKPPLIAWVIGAATAVCGDAAWCVRSPAALLHIGTAFLLAGLAARLFDRRTAFWTGVAWLTLPAVSYSSLIMSTDAVLLLFWSGTLFSYWAILTGRSWLPVLTLALAFGFGLNAKYAMAYVLLCMALHLAVSGTARRQARAAVGRLAAGFGLGALMLLPNIAWNAANGWATVGHTADNAHWQGIVLHFEELADFLGAQFGVFGPVFFLILLLAVPRTRRAFNTLSEQHRFLLSFSLPVLIVITVQALLSRANANWAATAYPAATILIVAWLRHGRFRRGLLAGSIGLHLAAAAAFYAIVLVPDLAPRGLAKKLSELEGWDSAALRIESEMQTRDIPILLMDNRLMMASLAYALRASDVEIRAWNHDSKIDHHYEMAWLYDPARDGDRALLVTPHGIEPYQAAFRRVTALPPIVRIDRRGRETVLELRVLEDPK